MYEQDPSNPYWRQILQSTRFMPTPLNIPANIHRGYEIGGGFWRGMWDRLFMGGTTQSEIGGRNPAKALPQTPPSTRRYNEVTPVSPAMQMHGVSGVSNWREETITGQRPTKPSTVPTPGGGRPASSTQPTVPGTATTTQQQRREGNIPRDISLNVMGGARPSINNNLMPQVGAPTTATKPGEWNPENGVYNKPGDGDGMAFSKGDWMQGAGRALAGLTTLGVGLASKPRVMPNNPYLDQYLNSMGSARYSNTARRNELMGNRLASLKSMSENYRNSNVMGANMQQLYSNYDRNDQQMAAQEMQMQNQISASMGNAYLTAGNDINRAQNATIANELERNKMIMGGVGDLVSLPSMYGQLYNTNLYNKRHMDVLRDTGMNFGPKSYEEWVKGTGNAIQYNR
jgi:hypothetical protein